eukprot:1106877-Prorocentrum_minimum.AAC.1
MGPSPPRTAALALGWGWVELGQPDAPGKDWITRQWPLLMRSPRPFTTRQPAEIWHLSHLRYQFRQAE